MPAANTARTPGRTNYVKNPDAHFGSPTSLLSPTTNNNNNFSSSPSSKNNNSKANLLGNSTANRFVLPPMVSPRNNNDNTTATTIKSPRSTNNKSEAITSPTTKQNFSPSPPTTKKPTSNNNNANTTPKTNTGLAAAHNNSSTNNVTASPNKKILNEKIPQIRAMIKEANNNNSSSKELQLRKAIDLLDELIGSPTYADLPMFDENHPNPPEYDNKVLFELLSLRIECWMALHQFGRVLDDITNAMRVDLQTALLRADFVIPKLKSLYDLGDIAIGLQVATSLEVAVARNGSLLDEVLEWKRKFVLASRKKNEVVESNSHGIVIGGRRFAAGAPLCRHGCPDKEPASFFQMEIVINQMSCQDTFLALYRLYTEYDGSRLSWKHWARQELRKAIDAAANENWKQCRDSTRHYLLATEFDKTGESFVDAMDTLGRVPSPVYGDTTARFFKNYDRSMSTVDDLVELLVEVSKPFCSCMNEIHELRSRRVKTQKQQPDNNNSNALNGDGENNNNTTNNTGGGKTRKGVTLTYGDAENGENVTTTAVVPTVPNPAVSAQLMKVKANIREAANLREEGNLLFLARKFRSALKCYEEAIELDSSNTELFFNRTAALYELEQYDAVVAACDKTLETASKNQTSDRTLGAKILARRADAMWKLGALDEALLNYQESLDAWDNESIRTKMIDCSIALQKKNLIASGLHTNNNNESNGEDVEESDGGAINKIINPKPSSSTVPPDPFASCVIVEPISSRTLGKTGHMNVTVFPTQIATASHFFEEAIPIPLMKFANFPFAVIPCTFSSSAPTTESNTNKSGGENDASTTNHPSSTAHTTANYNYNTNNNHSSITSAAENFFATIATRSLASDLSEQPMGSAHHRADLWSNCGSVIVLRKDFKPVTCGQVVQLFQLLIDVWGLGSSNSNAEDNEASPSASLLHQTGNEENSSNSREVKIRKKARLELFSSADATRNKILEYCGKIVDSSNEQPEQEQEEDQNEELLPGTHVINTFSEKAKLVKHNRGRDIQQAKMLKEQGNKLYKGRRFRTALLRYDEGLMLDAQNPELLFNRAAALMELGMFDIAIESCDRAIESVNSSGTNTALLDKISARKNLALKKLGKFDELEMLGHPANSLHPTAVAAAAEKKKKEDEENVEQQQQEEENDEEAGELEYEEGEGEEIIEDEEQQE